MPENKFDMKNIMEIRSYLNPRNYNSIKNIRNKIIVIPIQTNYTNDINKEIHVDIVDKQDLYGNHTFFNFNSNKIREYCAEYLLQGLRIPNQEDFSLVLFDLFIRELDEKIISTKYYKFIWDIQYEIHTYLNDTYNLSFNSYRNYTANIISCFNLGPLKKIEILNDEEALRLFCEICFLKWTEFFSDHVLIETNIIEFINYGGFSVPTIPPLYYDSKWIGYIVLNNEKVILDKIKIDISYKSIPQIMLKKHFTEEQISNGVIGYLDYDFMNTTDENVVLFKSYSDYIRYNEGNQNITRSSNGMIYISKEIDKEEFTILYKKYSLSNLCKICNTTEHYIQKFIKEYNLPKKRDL